MWFNNALLFQFHLDAALDLSSLLAEESLKPCPAHARQIFGWLPVAFKQYVQEVAGCSLIYFGKEERILPRSVINRLLSERVEQWEVEKGRPMKRSDKAQLAEELEFELLPKSFCVQKTVPALLDHTAQQLIINTSSVNQAAQLISLLRKSIPGIQIEPIERPENIASQFKTWLLNSASLPAHLALASDCLLFSPEDEKKRCHCRGYELPSVEILTLLEQGLVPSELSFIWKERIQFTLTQDFVLKRIRCLDYLIDEFKEAQQLEEDQQQDAALTLLAGELRSLISELLAVFQATVPMQVCPAVLA